MTMRKMTAIVAGGVGYVLGARAGRQRYEQIRSIAMKVKSNPKVQETATRRPTPPRRPPDAASRARSRVDSSSNGVNLEDSAYPKS